MRLIDADRLLAEIKTLSAASDVYKRQNHE